MHGVKICPLAQRQGHRALAQQPGSRLPHNCSCVSQALGGLLLRFGPDASSAVKTDGAADLQHFAGHRTTTPRMMFLGLLIYPPSCLRLPRFLDPRELTFSTLFILPLDPRIKYYYIHPYKDNTTYYIESFDTFKIHLLQRF